tara:strand:+ start:468 stop:701 length:234 start_codon:yes stop_codon:yes gene_type:complete
VRTKISWLGKNKKTLGLRTNNGSYDRVWFFEDRDEAKNGRIIADGVSMGATRSEYIKSVRCALREAGFAGHAEGGSK